MGIKAQGEETMGKFSVAFEESKNANVRKNNLAYEYLIESIDNVDAWKGCAMLHNRIDIRFVGLREELVRFLDGKVLKLDGGVELYRNTAASTMIITIEGDKITPSMDIDGFFKDLIDELKERIVEI